MSILQDYENIRKNIGYKKYDSIGKYLETICNQKDLNKYFKEMSKQDVEVDKLYEKSERLKKQYGIVLLDDVLYKKEEWNKFEIWYNENYLHRSIEILNTWIDDDYLYCNAILYKDEKSLANIIESYEETDIRYSKGDKDSKMNEQFIKNSLKQLLYNDFDKYLELPKISQCSNLLQEIYTGVCAADSGMCHISEEDWNDFYSEEYTNEDFEKFKLEVERLGLEDVIDINDGEYKIVGYMDLQTRFNDDNYLNNERGFEI